MAIKCEKCQFDQKSSGDKCENCHAPLTHKEKFVICTVCGLSNDGLAKTCIGCNAKLKHNDAVEFEKDMPLKKDLDSKSLFFNNLFSKFKKIPKKHLLLGGGTSLGIFLLVIILFMIFKNDYYIQPEEGFYYISGNDELFIIDEDKDKTMLLSGVESVESVKKFKKNIYFLADGELYHYKKKKATLLAEDVYSFKVNLEGDKLLYTVFVSTTGYGDLYLYDGKDDLRIDGNVGHERYIFDSDDKGVFYVKDITDEESLGTLYYKNDDAAPKRVADDVYAPLLSLETETVYFARKDIYNVEKFELYYYNNKQIIEIDRHVKHLLVHPKEEQVYFIQDKNSVLTLSSTEDGDVKIIKKDILDYGQYTYGDINKPLVYLEPYFFVFSQSTQGHYYVDSKGVKSLEQTMENYIISTDNKVIYTVFEGDVDVFEFKDGKMKDKYNIGSKAELITVSPQGKYGVIKKNTGEIVLSDRGKEIKSPEDGIGHSFSENEKYIMYQIKSGVYVHKITAKEPVYLSENPSDYFMLDDEVYYFEDGKVFNYRLGKFKSKKQLDTYKTWSYLE